MELFNRAEVVNAFSFLLSNLVFFIFGLLIGLAKSLADDSFCFRKVCVAMLSSGVHGVLGKCFGVFISRNKNLSYDIMLLWAGVFALGGEKFILEVLGKIVGNKK